MSPAPRWGYTGLILGVVVAIAVWISYQAGWLAAWDGAFYDQLLSLTTGWRNPEPKVLLLRIPREAAWPDATAINTLETLNKLGARVIVINFLPHGHSRDFFAQAAKLGNVVFGRELRPDPDNPEKLQPDVWPVPARELNLPWGVVSSPGGLNGVYRWQQASIRVGTEAYPSLESRAAEIWDSNGHAKPAPGPFLVNFVGGPNRLPNVSLSRLVAGDLIPEMVKGKAVIVGIDGGLLGLETPVSSAAETMTFLEFQANALQTLLDGSSIRTLGRLWILCLLVGLSLVSSLLYQRASTLAGARLVVSILVISALATLAALWFLRFWIPLGAMVLAQVGQFGLILLFKTRMTHRALTGMRLHLLNQIKERFSARNIISSQEYWDQVASMINQTLNVERMVLFERGAWSKSLLVIKAVNCRFEDLKHEELNLDSPVFSAALAKGEPARITGFFGESPEPQEEYLCPLVYGGELLGMWAAGISPADAQAIPQFDQVLGKFSRQLARLLFQKRQTSPDRSLASRFRAWFSAEKEDQAFRELRSTIDVLEQYYDVLESIMGQVGTAMIAYDFFGRVLKANDPAQALLRAENFLPERATALEFLRLVTGLDELQRRNLLRNVLMEGAPASMPVRFASQADRRFLLRVFPLSDAGPKPQGLEPFNVRGIVCELIETTSLSTLASLKGVVADRLAVELRDHLAAIEISAALLESDDLSVPQRRPVLDAIHEKIKVCVQVISECENYLGRNVDAFSIDCFPVDAIELLRLACSSVNQKATERGITLQIEQPHLMAEVMASTSKLADLFSNILALLVRDAAENTALSVKVEDFSNTSSFCFANCGFGIPNDRLQAILTNPEPSASEEFQILRKAVVWVRNWGGSIDITSEVGKGFNILLRLRQFNLTTANPANQHS